MTRWGCAMQGPIVVGTDGSGTANEAVRRAVGLAQAFDQELHIVSAYRPIVLSSPDLPPEFATSVVTDGAVNGVLDEAAAEARANGITVTTHAVMGDAASALIDIASAKNADLIVIGNKGIGSMKRFVLGNVPSKVVHHAPCSVHVVHTTE